MEFEGIARRGSVLPQHADTFISDAPCRRPVRKTETSTTFAGPGLQAHNRWLADFCSESPAQRAGVAEVLLYDIDDTVEEVRAIHASGLRGGIVLPVDGDENGLSPIYYTDYEPLWGVCEDLGVPVHRHARAPGARYHRARVPGGVAIGIAEVAFWDHRALSHIVFSGVLERHPGLRFVFTETGVGWLPAELARLDGIYARSQLPKEDIGLSGFLCDALAELTMNPSGYFARNCWVGASLLTPSEGLFRDQVGVSKMMWGWDFPCRRRLSLHAGCVPVALRRPDR